MDIQVWRIIDVNVWMVAQSNGLHRQWAYAYVNMTWMDVGGMHLFYNRIDWLGGLAISYYVVHSFIAYLTESLCVQLCMCHCMRPFTALFSNCMHFVQNNKQPNAVAIAYHQQQRHQQSIDADGFILCPFVYHFMLLYAFVYTLYDVA